MEIDVNGIRLHYIAEGGGPPVILLHGNGESHEIFEHEIRQLTATGYRVYAPDSRGQGANDPLPEYHYRDMAEDMYQFITQLGLHRPAMYGFSDGGLIALMLELTHPGTLGLMALSGTNLSPAGLSPDFLARFAGDGGPLVHLMLTEPDIDPLALRHVDIPTLVTAGSDDLVLPEETARIAAGLPRARMVIVPDADHGSYIVGSDVMGDLLIEFFRDNGY